MVLQIRPVRGEGLVLKEEMPKEPVSLEVVAVSPPESAKSVPQAKPRTVAFAPPVAVMSPLRTAVVEVRDVAADVVTVGAAHEAPLLTFQRVLLPLVDCEKVAQKEAPVLLELLAST